MGRRNDYTNQKFHRLTGIEPTDRRLSRKIIWKWQCDCGNIHYATGSGVKSGNTKSCGCLSTETIIKRNLANALPIKEKYGLLTPIKNLGFRISDSDKRRTYWLCRCDCGNEIEVKEHVLKTGNTSSCGCLVSKGENIITRLLTEMNIVFSTQKTFDDLFSPNNSKLRYDFCIYDEQGNIQALIEFDGPQHKYPPGGAWGGDGVFEKIQFYDDIKNKYALEHKYSLYRIPFNMIDQITSENILHEKFLVKGEEQ